MSISQYVYNYYHFCRVFSCGVMVMNSCYRFDTVETSTSFSFLPSLFFFCYCSFVYLAIIKWGWVGYEEFYRSMRVLSTEAESDNISPWNEYNVRPTVPPFCSNNQNNSTLSPGFLGQRFNMTNYWTDDVILTSSAQYDSSAAGSGELCVWFYPIRNGEIFWINNDLY